MSITNDDRLYGNILFLSPNGDEMFRSNLKKANWYLSKGLAKIISEDPPVVKFSFEPQGKGHDGDLYYLSEKANICVVCGSTDGLTKHHSVPYEFRKLFHTDIKESSCHDIVILCEECHDNYNKIASEMYRKLREEVGMAKRSQPGDEHCLKLKAISAARTIKYYKDDVPPEKIIVLENLIKEYTKKDCITDKMIDRLAVISKRARKNGGRTRTWNPFAISVVKLYGDEALSIKWRKHFVESMNPRFLPIGWDAEKPYRRNRSRKEHKGECHGNI